MDNRNVTIGELARAAGVNVETIRYYERIKLLPQPVRAPRRHRIYGQEHLRRLVFIRRARELQFSIVQVHELLAFAGPGQLPCCDVKLIAAKQLTHIRAKISDLCKLELMLATAVEKCSGQQRAECPVLDLLDSHRTLATCIAGPH
jgi:MerR family mercuric resistance operon transcriptional regulator